MIHYHLTTTDNPFDPFDEFDEWNAWDQRAGHHTLSYFAYVAKTSDELSEADQQAALDQAMDEIIEYDVLGIYKKVSKIIDDQVV